ncbi:hypothetical protein LCGC14_1491270, partial [marine sediment metagenome]
MPTDKIPYVFPGPVMDASVPSTALLEGSCGRLVGVDGRYRGCLRKFYGMSEVKDIDEISTGIDANNGPSYMKAVTFQKRGTSSVYRGFVISWDEGNDTTNLALDLFYTLDNGSNWSSHEIWAQSSSGITTTTEIDVTVAGAFLLVAVDGKATKTVYYKTSALTTVSSGPGVYDATLTALTDSDTSAQDDSSELKGDGVYNVAWRFYDSTRGIYSALSDTVTLTLDLFKFAKATGSIDFASGGGDSGLLIGGDLITIGSRTYGVYDDPHLLLNFEGTDAATSTTDASDNAHAVTFGGDAQLDTGVTIIGSSTLLLDGVGDYLSLADHADWDLTGSAADNWTASTWVNLTDRTRPEVIMGQFEDAGNFWALIHVPGQGLRFYVYKDGSAIIDTGYSGEITDGNDHHVAVCKVADEWGVYKDATQTDYVQDATTDTLAGALIIGAHNKGNEDFTMYSETDPGADVAITSSKITVTNADTTTATYVVRDMGVNWFTGDFTHRLEFELTTLTTAQAAPIVVWAVADAAADVSGWGDFIWFGCREDNNDFLEVRDNDGNAAVSSAFTKGTTYFATIAMDVSAGANGTGQIVATIRTGSHAGSVFDTLTIDRDAGGDVDYRYVYGFALDDSDINNRDFTGFVQNFSLSDSAYGDYLKGNMDALQIVHSNIYGAAPVVGVTDTFTLPTLPVPDTPATTTVDVTGLTTLLQHTNALANSINGDTSAVVTASSGAVSVTLESKVRGATGNTYALTESEAGSNTDDISVSAATLSGGGILTKILEPHCKAVMNFPADDAVISGVSTFAGFDALFDTVDVFRSINLGDVVSTEGAILYLEQTLSMPANEGAWDAPLTVTLGTKLDEALPFQITYDPQKDIVLAPPQSGTVGRYQKITFMAEATGVDSLSKTDYDTVHSSIEHVSPEYFTTFNRRKGDPEEGRPLRFLNAGDAMLILEPNAIVHVFKTTDLKPLVYTVLHRNRGLTGKGAAHVVGNSVFMITGVGLAIIDANNGQMNLVSAANRVLLGSWLADLPNVQSCYDSHMNASFFLNPTDSEMLILWHSTKMISMLEGANFVTCSSTVDITASSNKKTRAYFITDTGLIVTPDYLRAGTGTMWGLATGTTLDGTVTTASAGGTNCIDSGATFHADMVGCLIYYTSGDNAGEGVEITSMAAGNLTHNATTSAIAVGDRYAVSPVPFKGKLWPLQIRQFGQETVNPFLRKIIKGMEMNGY